MNLKLRLLFVFIIVFILTHEITSEQLYPSSKHSFFKHDIFLLHYLLQYPNYNSNFIKMYIPRRLELSAKELKLLNSNSYIIMRTLTKRFVHKI